MHTHPLETPMPAARTLPLLVLASALAAALALAALLWLPEIDRGAPPPATDGQDAPAWAPIVQADARPALA